MNQAIRKTLAVAAFGLAAMAASGAAQAGGVNWHIGINLPGVYYPAPPVVYGPPPVVYAPPPVYYQPPPRVIYQPSPIYYEQPAPVYAQPYPRGHWHEGRWRDDDRRGGHRRDGYGYGYRDRDGDGRPDRYRY
jgi:hypothetical protein